MNSVCAIVVTFNRKELLLRNLNSIFAQTVPCDLLIVDNASTDGTRELLEEKGILARDGVHYFRSEINRGGQEAFPRAFALPTKGAMPPFG